MSKPRKRRRNKFTMHQLGGALVQVFDKHGGGLEFKGWGAKKHAKAWIRKHR